MKAVVSPRASLQVRSVGTRVAASRPHLRSSFLRSGFTSGLKSQDPCSLASLADSHSVRFTSIVVASTDSPDSSSGGSVEPPPELADVETAKEAIDLGISLTQTKRWAEALIVFERSMNLPGSGQRRFRDKPRSTSDGEKIAALFNIACCQSKLGDSRSGLVALGGCLELGYADFNQIRTDPDLEGLREDPRFEEVLKRFEPKKGFFGFFGK
eukprot:gene25738-11398_t